MNDLSILELIYEFISKVRNSVSRHYFLQQLKEVRELTDKNKIEKIQKEFELQFRVTKLQGLDEYFYLEDISYPENVWVFFLNPKLDFLAISYKDEYDKNVMVYVNSPSDSLLTADMLKLICCNIDINHHPCCFTSDAYNLTDHTYFKRNIKGRGGANNIKTSAKKDRYIYTFNGWEFQYCKETGDLIYCGYTDNTGKLIIHYTIGNPANNKTMSNKTIHFALTFL